MRQDTSPTSWALAAATFVVAVGGCASFDQAVLPDRTREGNVYLVAGIFDYGDSDLKSMARALCDEGYNAQWVSRMQTGTLVDKVAHAHVDGTLRGPVVLVGYSMGGDDITGIARDLGKSGMTIDGLVVVDGFGVGAVPANVRSCANIYKPGVPPLYLGGAIKAESPATELVNIDMTSHEAHGLNDVNVTHWNMLGEDRMRSLILEHVHRYLHAGSAAATAPDGVRPAD